jgi:hypothetical protein
VPLFKNLSNQYLERFLAYGEVALRPFRYFARIEDVRGDHLEGTRGLTIRDATEPIHFTTDEFWTPGNIVIRSLGRPAPIDIAPSATVNNLEQLPAGYLFCVSESIQPQFGEAAYSINDAEIFKDILSASLSKEGQRISYAGFDRVRYGEHKDVIRDTSMAKAINASLRRAIHRDDYFLKPSTYANEREWRFIFLLEEGEETQDLLIVQEKALLSVCSRA